VSGLVVGIGNASCGDDGVGPEVALRVAGLDLPDVEVVVHRGPLALVEHLAESSAENAAENAAEHAAVVVVDATAPRGEPGRVRVVEVGSTPLRFEPAFGSSHGIGVAEAVELARALGRLPRRLTLVGVEASGFEVGAPLSSAVADRLDDAVRAVVAALPAPSGEPLT
jgi:hydrogenase maturation protease